MSKEQKMDGPVRMPDGVIEEGHEKENGQWETTTLLHVKDGELKEGPAPKAEATGQNAPVPDQPTLHLDNDLLIQNLYEEACVSRDHWKRLAMVNAQLLRNQKKTFEAKLNEIESRLALRDKRVY